MAVQALRRRSEIVKAAVLVAGMAVASLLSLAQRGATLPEAFGTSDFSAYYCSARVILDGGDPYHTAPLAGCEQRSIPIPLGLTNAVAAVDPAPFPGYVIALFIPFAMMPFGAAAAVWFALLFAAIVATAFLLRSYSGLPLSFICATLYGTELLSCFAFGQLAPIVALGVTAAGWLAARGRRRIVWLPAALTLLAPQVGLAVALAIVVWMRASRFPMLLAVAVAGALSVAALGWSANVEYVGRVLPAQTLAQAPLNIQYSLTWALYAAGTPEKLAATIASCQYFITVALAVAGAGFVTRRLCEPAAIPFLPAAAAVLGGPYVHFFQLCSALPAAVMLAATRTRFAVVGYVAALLLLMPFDVPLDLIVLNALAAACIAAAYCRRFASFHRLVAAGACALAVLFGGLLLDALPATPLRTDTAVAAFSAVVDGTLASSSLGVRVRKSPLVTAVTPRTVVEKAAGWLSLLSILAGLMAATARGAQRLRAERRRERAITFCNYASR